MTKKQKETLFRLIFLKDFIFLTFWKLLPTEFSEHINIYMKILKSVLNTSQAFIGDFFSASPNRKNLTIIFKKSTNLLHVTTVQNALRLIILFQWTFFRTHLNFYKKFTEEG